MLGQALTLWRRHLGAFLVASAIALMPAHVVKTGLLAALRYRAEVASNAGPVARQPAERQERLRDQVSANESPPARDPGKRTERALDAIRDLAIRDLPEASKLETFLLDALLLAASLPLFAAGVYFALAALMPMIEACRAGTPCSAAQAWEIVGARFGALAMTCALAAVLILAGVLFFVLPGFALALGFVFALPAVLVEGQCGIGALSRALALAGRVMPRLIGVAILFPLFRLAAALGAAAILPRAAMVPRLLLADAVSILLFPLPIAALALLFDEARRSATATGASTGSTA
jgi:hypothetical protein